jgi:DNA-directed RNA polymerase specialized sigma24 family protein
MCLDGFLRNEEKAGMRLKRGGAYQIMSFDFDDAEHELIHSEQRNDSSPDEYFDREWVRSLYALTVRQLKDQLDSQKKSVYFQVFELCDLHEDSKVSYADLSKKFDLPVTRITNYLAYARRQFRRLLLEQLRTITVSEQEFREEAQILLGVKK